MSLIQEVNKKLDSLYKKKNIKIIPIKVGDIISIEYYSIMSGLQLRKFIGICIAIKKKKQNNNKYITLRNVFEGIAMEFSFYEHWTQLVSIKKVGVKYTKVRRAKLYYLRNKSLSKSIIN